MMDRTKRINHATLLTWSGIFIFSLTARITRLIVDPLLMRDSVLYIDLVDVWTRTGNYLDTIVDNTVFPPIPLFVTKIIAKYGLGTEISSRGIALFLGAMIPVLGYEIGRSLFKNENIAIICSLILIFHPTLISYSTQPIRENFYLFFLGLSIISLIDGIKKSDLWSFFVCGFLSSTAIFCRYEATELLIIYPLITIYLFLKKRVSFVRATQIILVYYSAVFLFGFILTSLIDFDSSFLLKYSYYSKEAINTNAF